MRKSFRTFNNTNPTTNTGAFNMATHTQRETHILTHTYTHTARERERKTKLEVQKIFNLEAQPAYLMRKSFRTHNNTPTTNTGAFNTAMHTQRETHIHTHKHSPREREKERQNWSCQKFSTLKLNPHT